MKTKPFDLEEAKAGKPFRYKGNEAYTALQFFGVRANGSVVYEIKSPHHTGETQVTWAPPDNLEMIVETKKTTVYLYRMRYGGGVKPFASTLELHADSYVLLGQTEIEWEEK